MFFPMSGILLIKIWKPDYIFFGTMNTFVNSATNVISISSSTTSDVTIEITLLGCYDKSEKKASVPQKYNIRQKIFYNTAAVTPKLR